MYAYLNFKKLYFPYSLLYLVLVLVQVQVLVERQRLGECGQHALLLKQIENLCRYYSMYCIVNSILALICSGLVFCSRGAILYIVLMEHNYTKATHEVDTRVWSESFHAATSNTPE